VPANDVVELVTLPPDAGLVNSLGAHHTLESAVADLVDNSIDAGASHLSIRLLTAAERLTRVEVVDDGLGMDGVAITHAMTIGHQRDYVSTDLGHFGMGLKASSFGHANVLTVWSTAAGTEPVGRRIKRADFSKNFSCEVLSTDAAAIAAARRRSTTGTTVVWDEIRHGYRGQDDKEATSWLAQAEAKLRAHLGTVFHRLIENRGLVIEVVVEDLADADGAIGVPVRAIDPFGYTATGHPDYPKRLVATIGETKVAMTCHVWPAKKDVTGFRIGEKPGETLQGFFVYRNDRLLFAGGWADTTNPARERQLARVVLDDPKAVGAFVTMNPEKHGLRFEHGFHDAVAHAAADDGTVFEDFIADAESVFVEANKRRSRHRAPAIMPTKGFAPRVRKAIERELPMIHGEELQVRWRSMPEDEFLDVDFSSRVLYLNSRYRHLFSPERGSLNDAPMMKALLYLLTHKVYEGQILGARDKDDIMVWKSVLAAAAKAEADLREGR
jgi:hypothetical protein